MRPNRVKELWRAGKPVLNGWCALPCSLSAEMVARQGWDSVLVDLQHGGVDEATALHMLQAISTTDAVPFVRPPWLEPGVIMRLLDAGAYGVVCPMVNTRADAELLVSACRYPPQGMRSNGAFRGVLYGGADYVQKANDEIVVLAMIETKEALANVAEIVATPGLDGVYVGPTDLAISLGHGPRIDVADGPIGEAIAHIRKAAHAAGKVAGAHGTQVGYAVQMLTEGFNFMTPTADFRALQMGMAATLSGIREKMPGARR